MRSLLTRLAALGIIVAVTGCVGPGSSASIAGSPNNGQVSAGNPQTNVTGPGGTGGVTPAANTIAPLLIDNGTRGTAIPTASYIAFSGGNITDVQSATQSPADTSPAPPAPSVPPNPSGATDLGSHTITVTNVTAQWVLFTSNQTYNLTYTFGGQTVDYSTLVAHFAVPAGTIPTSISAEYVSATNPNSSAGFDIRQVCTGAAALGATFVRFTCPIPAFAAIPAVNNSSLNAVNPNASEIFAPTAAKIYFVLNYIAAGVPPPTTTTTLGIDNVYLTQ